MLPESVKSKYQDLLAVEHQGVKLLENRHQQQSTFKPEEILYKTLGFSVAQATSSLISAGKGVFVTKGLVPKGAVVSMYPGNSTINVTLCQASYLLINISSIKYPALQSLE